MGREARKSLAENENAKGEKKKQRKNQDAQAHGSAPAAGAPPESGREQNHVPRESRGQVHTDEGQHLPPAGCFFPPEARLRGQHRNNEIEIMGGHQLLNRPRRQRPLIRKEEGKEGALAKGLLSETRLARVWRN